MKFKRAFLILLPVLFTAQACNFFSLTSEEGSGTRGIFRSSDSGAAWEAASRGAAAKQSFAGAQVSRLFVEEQEPVNLLAATLGSGLLGSDNRGDTWVVLLPRVAVYDAFISRSNHDEIFAAGNRDRVAAIYKSVDRGKTWTQVYSEAASATSVTALESPGNDGKVLYAGLSSGALLQSQDGGSTWQGVADFKDRIVDIVAPAQNPQKVFALTRSTGLHRSSDGGATWTNLKVTGSAETFFTIATEPRNPETIYTGTAGGLFRSSDCGATWTRLPLPATPSENSVTAAAINPQDSRQIFAAIRWTLYRSDDGGESWRTAALPTRRVMGSIVIDPQEPNRIYAGFK